MGDDVIDLPVMRNCGLGIAVANARAEVKKDAHYVTPHAGGDGALRDAIEYILKAQGKWKQVVSNISVNVARRKAATNSFWRDMRWARQLPESNVLKNPPVACLGRARVDDRWATVSPYSPCCFQEYLLDLTPGFVKSRVRFCKVL